MKLLYPKETDTWDNLPLANILGRIGLAGVWTEHVQIAKSATPIPKEVTIEFTKSGNQYTVPNRLNRTADDNFALAVLCFLELKS